MIICPKQHLNNIWSSIPKNVSSALSGMRRFSAAENPSKMMKNTFYFTSKALFVLKIFKFLSWLFGYVSKRLDEKGMINFKIYDVTAWLTNNCDTYIVQDLENKSNQTTKFG